MTTLPRGRSMTRANLEALLDDGWRHELVDGALVTTPAPRWRHQSAIVRLLVALDATCPGDLRVVVAPFSVVLGPDTVVQPDLLVAPRAAITETELLGAPVLAVEVLSPSTTHIDLGLKKQRYAAAGCPAYWVVDPGTTSTEPSITAFALEDGIYVEAAASRGDEPLTVASPYPVRVVPAELIT
ncbi:Uma2 family endonuclease [Nocardioides endophyticus]